MIGLSLVVLSTLSQQPANPYLARAQAFYDQARFPEALEQLQLAREVPGMDRGQQLALNELSAHCLLAEGRQSDAESSFARMLALDPSAELDPRTSPKITSVFAAVKAATFPRDYVELRSVLAPDGTPEAELVDPWHRVDRLVVLRRGVDEPAFSEERPRRSAGRFRLLDPSAAPRLWYAEARGADGEVVARLGTAEQPNRYGTLPAPVTHPRLAPVADTAAGPLAARARTSLRRTAGWVSLGAASVAIAAGALLQASSDRSHQQAIGETWFDASAAWQQRSRTEAIWAGALVGVGAAAGLTGGVLLVW